MVHAHEKFITTVDANSLELILTGSIDKTLKRYTTTQTLQLPHPPPPPPAASSL
jgi:hypothetical protein